MPNHCMNRIKMVFKEKHVAKQLKTDLETLGEDQKDNLCQLVFPYDYDSKKMGFPDGSVKTLEEGLGCPAGEYWGTKWGTYNLSLGFEDDCILEYYFDTAWGPVSTEVLSELFKKYNLTSIVNNYWEPGCAFAGTYSSDDGQISDTEDDYEIINVESVSYDKFLKLVNPHYDVEVLTTEQLKVLFRKFIDYELMYSSFEKRAYEAFIDEDTEPMFNTFIINSLKNQKIDI